MLWYFGNVWTAYAQAEGKRAVTCSSCGCQFGYPVELTATGVARSPYFLDEEGAKQRAQERADEQLTRIFDSYVVPMPCPGCGDYQPEMIDAMKRRKYPFPFRIRRWMVVVYAVLGMISVATLLGTVIVPNFYNTPLVGGFFVLIPWALATVLLVPVFAVQALQRRMFKPYLGTTAEDRMADAEELTYPLRPLATPLLSPILDDDPPVGEALSPIFDD
jgi:hypothetical protein